LVATYEIVRVTGSGPTLTVVSNVRLRTDDANTADLTNPCKIKAVKTRSFYAHIGIRPQGTFAQVSNIRHHSDGAIGWTMGTTGKLKRGNRDTGDHGVPLGSYDQATGSVNDTGDDLETAHAYYASQTVKSADIENDTSVSPALIDSTPITVANTLSKMIVIQVELDTNAVQGVQATETMTFLVDEI
jgi:hypothetical protein